MLTIFIHRRWIVSFAVLVALGWQVDNALASRPGKAPNNLVGAPHDSAQRDLRNRVGLPDEKQLGDFLGLPPARSSANRSTWHEAGANHLANVNERWNTAIADGADRERINNWAENHAERWNELQAWGDGVRDDWAGGAQNYFSDAWWQQNPVAGNWWHYHYGAYRPWSYWWTAPTWGALTAWLAPVGGWGTGCYYDYGAGGNVAYEDDQVTVNDDPVGSTEEIAQSAAELATVTPPADTDEAAESQWMALGTFAVSKSFGDTDGPLVVQLAVDREGIVSGALYDRETNQSSVLQGRVDRETQRIAFNSVDDRDTVYETGIYDLLQSQASVLIHYGPAEAVDVLFVRLETPAETSGPPTP